MLFAMATAFWNASALALEDSDVMFFAPFEGSARAAIAEGDPSPRSKQSNVVFRPGVRGRAIRVEGDPGVAYAFHRNVLADEGSIAMWVKPEWPVEDDQFHYFFRAATGHYGGKALNAIMLYKYRVLGRVLFYISNGQKTHPSEGRSIAFQSHVKWKAGEWKLLVATWSATLAATEMRLYIDGQCIGETRTPVFAPEDEPPVFTIGGGRGATWFDDVMVFNRPLAAREVAALFDSYKTRRVADARDLPFVPTREIVVEPYVNFQANALRVRVDYRAGRRQLAGKRGRLRVEVLGAAAPLAKEVEAARVGVAVVAFDYDRVKPGPRRVRATLTNARGAALRKGETDYVVPRKPVWIGNDLGKGDSPPPPWTPVRVRGDALEAWGRTYAFADSPFPAAITSQSRPLLRGPIRFVVRRGDRAFPLAMRGEGAFAGGSTRVRRAWTGRAGPLDAAANTTFEFDGFLRVDLTLTPRSPTRVSGLELVIPLRGETTTLYHHANASWSKLSDAGAIDNVGRQKSLPFVPYVWLGNERGGLAWVCEHNNNWRNADENRAVEIVRADKGVDLRVRLCDVETALTRPLRFSFGFLATPVKPLPPRWRAWRQVFISALNIKGFVKTCPTPPCFRNIGVLYNNHVGAFSYLPRNPAEMKRKVSLLHSHGWRTVVSYFALTYTQIDTPEYKMMAREWRRDPFSQNTTAGRVKMPYGSVCPASSWTDFLLWVINKTMDETGTDGVYLDCSNPCFCRSAEHGCAPGRYPIFEIRELQKRIYTLVHAKRGANGFVYSHNSENNILTTFAFSDAVLNGEQYNKKDLRTLTFAKFRAEFLPYSSGVPSFLLPTLTKRQPNRREKMPGTEFLAFPLLHDVICLRSYLSRSTRERLWRIRLAMAQFGAADAEFLPYWSNGREIAASPAGSAVSAYLRRDGCALLLIAQAANAPQTFRIALRGRLARLAGQPARTLLERQPLTWSRGALVWPMPDRSVRLVVVEAPKRPR